MEKKTSVPSMRQLLRDASKVSIETDNEQIRVGDVVSTVLAKAVMTGICQFVGLTEFSSGVWVGIELNTPAGKNDGVVQNKRYFTCKANHGVFVRIVSCTKVSTSASASASATPPGSRRRSMTPTPTTPTTPFRTTPFRTTPTPTPTPTSTSQLEEKTTEASDQEATLVDDDTREDSDVPITNAATTGAATGVTASGAATAGAAGAASASIISEEALLKKIIGSELFSHHLSTAVKCAQAEYLQSVIGSKFEVTEAQWDALTNRATLLETKLEATTRENELLKKKNNSENEKEKPSFQISEEMWNNCIGRRQQEDQERERDRSSEFRVTEAEWKRMEDALAAAQARVQALAQAQTQTQTQTQAQSSNSSSSSSSSSSKSVEARLDELERQGAGSRTAGDKILQTRLAASEKNWQSMEPLLAKMTDSIQSVQSLLAAQPPAHQQQQYHSNIKLSHSIDPDDEDRDSYGDIASLRSKSVASEGGGSFAAFSPTPDRKGRRMSSPVVRSSVAAKRAIQTDESRSSHDEEKEFLISQLKKTLEIVAHMAKQASELAQQERNMHQDLVTELEARLSKYELEIQKKYAILK